MQVRRRAAIAATLALTIATGCRIDTHKDGDGEDVKVETPFGGVRVKTSDTATLDGIGLPAYPGAELIRKGDKGKNNSSADIAMSFGSFHLRVEAASYRTPDATEKVKAFYRTGLNRFGDVIECRDNVAVGTPVRTAEGLTCDSGNTRHPSVENHRWNGSIELKVGSSKSQHIVEIEPEGAGTKFGLVALELPGRLFDDAGSDEDKQ
jgi:hypothetical protein